MLYEVETWSEGNRSKTLRAGVVEARNMTDAKAAALAWAGGVLGGKGAFYFVSVGEVGAPREDHWRAALRASPMRWTRISTLRAEKAYRIENDIGRKPKRRPKGPSFF